MRGQASSLWAHPWEAGWNLTLQGQAALQPSPWGRWNPCALACQAEFHPWEGGELSFQLVEPFLFFTCNLLGWTAPGHPLRPPAHTGYGLPCTQLYAPAWLSTKEQSHRGSLPLQARVWSRR